MGRGRRKKRPPAAAETEDEALVFHFPIGAEVEASNDDPGFLGSFFEATVAGHRISTGDRACYELVYSTLQGNDGEPLRETADAAHVRPRPPSTGSAALKAGFAMHEMVEAFHNEGWWAGVVSAVPPPGVAGPRVYKVAFPTSRELLELEETALRPHRVFQGGRWVPAAEVDNGNPLFRERSQVEVSCSKFFGQFWKPATVSKVIGATNFLVQYGHVGEDGELVTEILHSEYIRPARTISRMDSKYRFFPSSHVEVFHEGSWWPSVILEVIGNEVIKKYSVKLKSHETDMDDVECVDVLTVENTQLRPQFDWRDRKWVRCSTEEPANGSQLISRKRPISATLALCNDGDEIRDKPGSSLDKKLKSAHVPEPVSPFLSVGNANYEIKHKSSSDPEEALKKGSALLALPSLPSIGHPSVRSSHLEQSSSQMIIVPSVPQCGQLQASLFGAFGQPRPLPHVPVLGMQSLNPDFGGSIEGSKEQKDINAGLFVGTGTDLSRKREGFVSFQTPEALGENLETPKKGIAAKTIEEANISEYLAKPTHGDDDDVELPNDATPLKDITGSQERFSARSSTQYGSKSNEFDKSVEQGTGEEFSQGSLAMADNAKLHPLLSAKSFFATWHDGQLAKDNTGAMVECVTGSVGPTENLSPALLDGILPSSGNFEVRRKIDMDKENRQGNLVGLPSNEPETQNASVDCPLSVSSSVVLKGNTVVTTGSSNKKLAANEQDEMQRQAGHSSAMVESAAEISIEKSAITQLSSVGTTEKEPDDSLTVTKSMAVHEDDRSLAIQQHLPFVKTSPMWAQIEAMEIFSRVPQQPNFHQFQQHGPELCEGMALGLMFSFANLAESINNRLNTGNVDDEVFKEKMKGLSMLETNYGFDVRDLRSRLETLLHIKKNHDAADAVKKLEDKEADDRLLGMQIRMLTMAAHHLELHSYLLRNIARSAISRRMNNAMEISRLKTEACELERSLACRP